MSYLCIPSFDIVVLLFARFLDISACSYPLMKFNSVTFLKCVFSFDPFLWYRFLFVYFIYIRRVAPHVFYLLV